MVRTYSTATFFSIFCLWRCMLLYKKLSLRNSFIAGLALGLAVATRYFMATFQMPIDVPGSQTQEVGTLAELGLSVDALIMQGYHYAILNQERYGRYYAEPERYPEAVGFYDTLFKEATLLQEFHNSPTQAGPTIQIYALTQ